MDKKKRLVVSWDSYSWIHEMAGYISRCPKSFDVIILVDDSDVKIHWLDLLCKDAVYAQRKYDLHAVGTKLGIKSLSNFLLDFDEENMEDSTAKLTARLQMYMFLNNPQEVYYQSNFFLDPFFKVIADKMNMGISSFGDYSKHFAIQLTDEEVMNKNLLLKLMVGLPHYQLEYSKKEYIYKIR